MTTLSQFRTRQRICHFVRGWGKKLYDAQKFTHYPNCKNPRIRCGEETTEGMAHLIPDHGALCHDCGAAVGEYHVPGCDAEECPGCHGQALGCDCLSS